jgi:hypothetical protein
MDLRVVLHRCGVFLVSSLVKLPPLVLFSSMYALDYPGKKEFRISYENLGALFSLSCDNEW